MLHENEQDLGAKEAPPDPVVAREETVLEIIRRAEHAETASRLETLQKNPLSNCEYRDVLEFNNSIYEDLVRSNGRHAAVVYYTGTPGSGKSYTKDGTLRLFNFLNEGEKKKGSEIIPTVGQITFDDVEDEAGEIIVTRIKRRGESDMSEEERGRLIRYGRILTTIVELEYSKKEIRKAGFHNLINEWDKRLTANIPERYLKGGTYSEEGRHAAYKPDHDDFLVAARNLLAINITEEIETGTNLLLVEASSGTLFATRKQRDERRKYPNEIMAHLKKKRGIFGSLKGREVKVGYCSISAGASVLGVHDRIRASKQMSSREEASEIAIIFGEPGINTVEDFIGAAKGGSLDVIYYVNQIERDMILAYAEELGIKKNFPDLYTIASLEKGSYLYEAFNILLGELEKSETEEARLKILNDGLGAHDARINNMFISSVHHAGYEFPEEHNAAVETLKVYAIKALSFLVQERLARGVSDFELHVLNDTQSEFNTIGQTSILLAMADEARGIREKYEE
jgi:hypothetical protein